ncbi:MAG: T9SS type A sorting domain-containing protein, partial [Bacteroidetes bacterium]
STNWYHPHLHMNTNKHVQKGIAGMIIVRDAEEAALSLPRTYGEDDFPIVVQTKGFDANNQIIIETALDTTLLVNGTKDPYLDAPAQWVRLRLLNGSSERYYNFGFSGNLPFKQIASDGGLLTAPVDLTRVMVAPGERAEIVIDLSALQGNTIQLMSYGAELASGIYGAAQPGMGAGQTIPNYALNPLNGANFTVMDINVVAPTANPITSISAALTTHTPWLEANADALKTLTFTPQTMGPTAIQGPFLINNAMFNMDVINYQIPLDNIEVWTLVNQSPIGHPFHIHDVSFYILDINGTPPPPNMQGRKDVVHVPSGNGTVRFITKFENYANDTLPYMYHCHILTHEDMGMMGQFVVYDPLGIKETQSTYKLYPNPSNTSLFFESAFSNETYMVIDQFGREVFNGNLIDGSLHLDLGEISNGIYLLSIPEKQINTRFIRN